MESWSSAVTAIKVVFARNRDANMQNCNKQSLMMIVFLMHSIVVLQLLAMML